MALPDNSPFYMLKLRKFTIRDCFFDIRRLIFDHFSVPPSDSHAHNVIVTGNPGIGKSCLFHYLLPFFKQEGYTVVYDPPKTQFPTVFQNGKAWRESWNNVENLLMDERTVYVVDGKEPGGVPACKVVVLVSNQPRHWKEFFKRGGIRLVMPTWSEEELEFTRQLVHPEVPKNKMQVYSMCLFFSVLVSHCGYRAGTVSKMGWHTSLRPSVRFQRTRTNPA